MNHQVNEFRRLLRGKKYNELSYRVLTRIPYYLFRYDRFYIMYCREIRNLRLFRPIKKDYRVVVEKFNYALLERLKREMPHDMGTVYYRAKNREGKTRALYIEHFNKIVTVSFVLADDNYISPSGYVLPMNRVITQMYGSYVHPEYRLKGFHFNMVKAAYDLSRCVGEPGLYAEIQYMNKNSFLSYSKVGFDVFKKISYVQLLGEKHFFEGPTAVSPPFKIRTDLLNES
jgi:GNAT superfamily N-acetyltransferase